MYLIKRLYVFILVTADKAVDIWSTNSYPSNVLSNLYPNSFEIDGIFCASMEGFLQSLKMKDAEKQREVCALSGKSAKAQSTSGWQSDQMVYWQGQSIQRQSQQFEELIHRAFLSLFDQSELFREALLSTRDKSLYHTRGISNSQKTILTEKEFCKILTKIRDSSD